ncbi:RNA polymerase sigma factor [Kribbella sp. CA-293567]|uniref:RNA polymerase sigma factor n=1 Tax=Kribbella sp. CA-293567 TaxID=3002436 RepID=UPI0022DDA6C2|nr:sigma-70 family RNA polymerase sigma factor [Kribbella sp. CA-293567]WBQ04373.1 sigma-70 family RNA polymerase sigma factor [Kribbella sp. CA-293567]
MSDLEFDVAPPIPEPDKEPAKRLSGPESEALRDFIEGTSSEAWRWSYWVAFANEHHAREIRANAFMMLARDWRKLAGERDHEGLKLWLFKTIRNSELARNRREVSQRIKAQKDTPLSRRETRSPEDAVLGQIMVDEVLKIAVGVLQPRTYDVFFLKVQIGLENDQIAERLGMRASTVRVQLTRARQALDEHPDVRKITGYEEGGNQ